MADPDEKVVMTPKSKLANTTTLIVERKIMGAEPSDKLYVAGGVHTGILINRQRVSENGYREPCHVQLQFMVYLVSAATGSHARESRVLRFWFKPDLPTHIRSHYAQEFFRELVSPEDFPKDYVGYIKKVMNLMHQKFFKIRTLEMELTQDGTGPPPPAFIEEGISNNMPVISEQRVLDMIENAYPNPLTVDFFVSNAQWSKADVKGALEALVEKGLTRRMAEGLYTRQHSVDTQVVGQMPTLCSSRQPTIAIITALFCEKQAVDAMMDNQETYVRYNTVGESNVYTLGTIGAHRAVTTKLPSVGRTREAMTAAGNTTTRLLGIFQKVEYVFLVGVGGGVPHYTDYSRHVRLGDVVASSPDPTLPDQNVYVFCETFERNDKGGYDFDVKSYKPANYLLQEIAIRVAGTPTSWSSFIDEGLEKLRGVPGKWKWNENTTEDGICVEVAEGAYIEISHPTQGNQERVPRLWCAPVAGGRGLAGLGEPRSAFAEYMGARAYDCELDAVLDSVVGNRKDCFMTIRGISDYRDGTRGKEWQPCAALSAAAVMKAIITAMDPPTE